MYVFVGAAEFGGEQEAFVVCTPFSFEDCAFKVV
jgi:hypothetical protein